MMVRLFFKCQIVKIPIQHFFLRSSSIKWLGVRVNMEVDFKSKTGSELFAFLRLAQRENPYYAQNSSQGMTQGRSCNKYVPGCVQLSAKGSFNPFDRPFSNYGLVLSVFSLLPFVFVHSINRISNAIGKLILVYSMLLLERE